MLTRWCCLLSLCLVLFCSTAFAVAGPVVLFDESHQQQFLIENDGPLDLSGLAAAISQNGCTVRTTVEPLLRENLADVDMLVISGAFQPLSSDEVDAIAEFISAGGSVAVMLHIAPPVGALLQRLEVDFSNGPAREMRHVIDNNPLNFKLYDFAEHPLTAGLESFSVYGSWALRGTADNVKTIAHSSDHSWVDLDHSGELSPGDVTQKFGVLVVGEAGQGRFAVFGDDALFQNRFLDVDNLKLVSNLVNWLSRR